MNYSAVIPTYKRGSELRRCVNNLLHQTLKPAEIIISAVEGDKETQETFEKLREEYPTENIRLITSNKRGISVQRNNGLYNASFPLVLMIDDDVYIPPEFASEGFKILHEEDALIVAGVEDRKIRPPLIQNMLRKIFYLDHYQKNKQFVLPSGAKVMAYAVDSDIRAEFLGAEVLLMKRCLIDHVKFDESMILYSHREDQDFSYAVYRKFGPKLLITPRLKFKHFRSPGGRLKRAILTHIFVYNLLKNYRKYFFDIRKTKIILLWALLGLILQSIHQAIKNRNWSIFIETVNAVFSVINKWNHIKRGDFSPLYGKLSK
ncbi:MAG: glycosyltransferase family 2 protein [bacterium]|nr:glycosyltransferase family 2 protein [bacterium]